MRTCKVRIPFKDLAEGVARNAGDTFICDDERALYLESLNIAWAGAIVEDKPKKTAGKKK